MDDMGVWPCSVRGKGTRRLSGRAGKRVNAVQPTTQSETRKGFYG